MSQKFERQIRQAASRLGAIIIEGGDLSDGTTELLQRLASFTNDAIAHVGGASHSASDHGEDS